jgi:hypothetical protein
MAETTETTEIWEQQDKQTTEQQRQQNNKRQQDRATVSTEGVTESAEKQTHCEWKKDRERS